MPTFDTMKRILTRSILLFGVIALAMSCGSGQTDGNENTRTIPSANASLIEQHIKILAADSLRGRMTATEGIRKAGIYLETQLDEYGYGPYNGSYRHEFSIDGKQGENVVAVLPGTDPELKSQIVLLGAHYDHIGVVNAVQGDSIANGANDNASGVATAMEVARLIKESGSNKRTVMIALFSAEEVGLIGSSRLASEMKSNGDNIHAMVNFEMTGVPMTSDKRSYITGYDMSNMADLFNAHIKQDTITGYLPQAAQFNLFRRSDNYPFYQAFSVPAQTISTFDFTNYDYYHKPGDHAELMDMAHMTSLIDELMPGMMDIINTDQLQLNSKSDG